MYSLLLDVRFILIFFFFFFNDTATTEIYTLSLHDALPIARSRTSADSRTPSRLRGRRCDGRTRRQGLRWGARRKRRGSWCVDNDIVHALTRTPPPGWFFRFRKPLRRRMASHAGEHRRITCAHIL